MEKKQLSHYDFMVLGLVGQGRIEQGKAQVEAAGTLVMLEYNGYIYAKDGIWRLTKKGDSHLSEYRREENKELWDILEADLRER